MILAGDIGGTNARLALYDDAGKRVLRSETFVSRAHRGLEPIVTAFLGRDRPKAAALGVAGPVVDDRCRATNLPWLIDGPALGRRLGIPKVALLNDLVAIALGCLAAPASRFVSLHAGKPRRRGATMAVIAAGTGLGEAVLVWDGARYVPQATEGSHVDFAPRDETEIELLRYMQRAHERVSYERVCSGSTLHVLYAFFADVMKVKAPASERARVAAAADPNVAVVELARASKRGPARAALDLFMSLYGAEAGNLALKSLATGGVFVCGGLSGHLAPDLAKSAFVRSFLAKGRMRPLLERTPVVIHSDSRAGLAGSAYHAASLIR